ncbi:hypothetical protein [Virgibacillus sp. DJP39]|uniref:hypothetical protein n=1 Tax=Virgibacillus sp. DJP39 TaxID=3409790 RepID=UPI003BB52816
MKKAKVVIPSIVILVAVLFLILHTTPKMALRTHVFFLGYPKAAITSEIVDDAFHNRVDKKKFKESNTKAYTLTEPPTEEATQGLLRNYTVKKVGVLYFADYLGEH